MLRNYLPFIQNTNYRLNKYRNYKLCKQINKSYSSFVKIENSHQYIYDEHKYPHPSSFEKIETPYFKFEILYKSKKSKARVGRITTPHGVIDTPGFVPVGTNGTLKFVDLQTSLSLGSQLMFCNTFHLLIHPGPDIVAEAGGIHTFINYNQPIITDSGGFQVFSLSNTQIQDELKGKSVKQNFKSLLLKNNEEGLKFRSYRDGRVIELTPETSVMAQKKIGADIIIPLDILLPNKIDEKKMVRSFHRTHRWEARSLKIHERDPRNQAMYSVIHGGNNIDMRKLSISYLSKLPFQGMAIGGSLGKNKQEMNDLIKGISDSIPDQLPIHLLGIGDPESILNLVKYGIDTFDSAYPTKSGRHGLLFSKDGNINGHKSIYESKHSEPVKGCKCPTCTKYSMAYMHHLFKMNEPVGMTLGAIHNLYYMNQMMKEIREMIMNDVI